jgi:hypothetical protein
MWQNRTIMVQSTNMIRAIDKRETKLMKIIKAPIMAGITDCAIKHYSRLFVSYSSRVLIVIPMEWLGRDWLIIMEPIAIWIAFVGSEPWSTGALDTKGPPIDNRFLWIDCRLEFPSYFFSRPTWRASQMSTVSNLHTIVTVGAYLSLRRPHAVCCLLE